MAFNNSCSDDFNQHSAMGWKSWFGGILITFIIVLAAAMRLYGATMPLSYDEVLQYRRATLPGIGAIFGEIFYPISTILTHFSLLVEHSPLWLRMPNLLGGLLAIYLIYLLMAQSIGRIAGLFSAAVVAVSPYHIHHSQDARYYGLMSAFWVFHLLAILWVSRGYKFSLICYFLSILIGLFNHPFFFLYAASAFGATVIYFAFNRTLSWADRARKVSALGLSLVISSLLLYLSKLYFEASLAPSEGSADSEKFFLTAHAYISMLKGIGTPIGVGSLGLWYGLAAVGSILLLWRLPAIGLVVLATTALLPLPLLFIGVGHWYDDRYFMPYSVNFAIVIGVAISQIFLLPWNLLKAKLNNFSCIIIRAASAACGVLLLGVLINSIPFEALHLQKSRLRHSWERIGNTLSQLLQSSDEVLHNLPTNNVGKARIELKAHTVKQMAVFAEEQFPISTIHEFIPEFKTNHHFGLNQPVDALKYAATSPFSNIWLIDHKNGAFNLPPQFSKYFKPIISTDVANLRVMGEPTTNMVIDGGFDSRSSKDLSFLSGHSNVAIVTDREKQSGKVLKLQVPNTTGTARAYFKLRPTEPFIRNRNFDLWKDGTPVGWKLVGPAESIDKALGFNGSSALKVVSSGEEAVLQSTIDGAMLPGSEIEIVAKTKTAVTSSPIRLAYVDEHGSKSVSLTRVDRNDSGWYNYKASAVIPSSAYSESFRFEIYGTSGKSAVIIDDLNVKILRPGRYFHRDRSYYLSCWLKAENINPGALPYWDQARIQIVAATQDEKVMDVKVAHFSGSFDWQYFHIPIDPNYIPHLSQASQAEVRILLNKCSGTLWVDDLQLEQNNHPTPFVSTTRPPHDEVLATLNF